MTYTLEFLRQAAHSGKPAVFIVTANKPIVDWLLSINTSNRKMRQTQVERLATDINSGEWELTGSGISVCSNMTLGDGQHRLDALRSAGYPPVQFVLLVGMNPEAQKVVDRHAKRSLSDALTLVSGRTISSNIVAASTCLSTIANSTNAYGEFTNQSRQPSDGVVAAAVSLWADDIEPVLGATRNRARSAAVAALAVYHRHNSEKALELCTQIGTGLELTANSPAYRLIEGLKRYRGGGTTFNRDIFGLTVSAICAHNEGKELKLIKPSLSWNRAFKPWMA
jgi:hypothetical protein